MTQPQDSIRNTFKWLAQHYNLPSLSPMAGRHWIPEAAKELSDAALARMMGHSPRFDVRTGKLQCQSRQYRNPGEDEILAEQETVLPYGTLGRFIQVETKPTDNEKRVLFDLYEQHEISLMDLNKGLSDVELKDLQKLSITK